MPMAKRLSSPDGLSSQEARQGRHSARWSHTPRSELQEGACARRARLFNDLTGLRASSDAGLLLDRVASLENRAGSPENRCQAAGIVVTFHRRFSGEALLSRAGSPEKRWICAEIPWICCGHGYVAGRAHRPATLGNPQFGRNIIFRSQSVSRKAISPLSFLHGRSGPSSAASHSAIALALVSRSISA